MPRHLALPGHLLIYGVYPELKRLRRTPAVVGWRPSEDASRDATSPPPASRRAPSIFHCLEGSSVVAITSRDRPCSCYSADGFWIFTIIQKRRRAEPSETIVGEAREKKRGSVAFFSRRRARFVSRVSLTKSVSPRFPSAAQETKRQGERAGHDRIQALELRQGFPRRQRLGRFGTSSGETVILRSEATRAEFVARFFFSLFSRLASRPL